MKGLHLSDIHNDSIALATVKNWAKRRVDLEFVAVTGDILHPILDSDEANKENYAFSVITDFISNNVKLKEGQKPELGKILGALYNDTKIPKEIKQAIEYHARIINRFDKASLEQYTNIIDIFRQFPQKVMTIP